LRPAASSPGAASLASLGLAPWLAIFALALVTRLVFVAVVPKIIPWADSRDYEALGRMLFEHGTYGRQTIRTPGYPTLIAAVYHLFGPDLTALRTVEAVLGALAAAGLGWIGATLFGRTAGILAGLLMALHPVIAFMPSTQYSENTSIVLMVATLGAGFEAIRRGGGWRWILLGVLLGAGTLVRANLFVFFPGWALGAAALRIRERRAWFVPLVLTGLTMALTVTPWIVRNHRVWNHWYFVSTGGGRQFYFGNNPYTDLRTDAPALPDSAIQAELGRLPTTFMQDSLYYRRGWEFVGAHPGRAAHMYLVKLGHMYALCPEPTTRSFINDWSRITQGVASVVIYLGALIGLSRFPREPAMWPMVLGTLSFTAATALVFTSLRYRLVVEPCILLIAGLGWAMLLARLRPAAEPA
jgi:4-amino-4-deoxy-L-arabinose transferase-like glycosyltransferase